MEDNTSDGREKRKYFRVRYPQGAAPKLLITKEAFDIIDISEQGIRFDLGKTIRMTIIFHDGESVDVEGKLLRTKSNEIVIKPLKSISSERIAKEQRYLMRKYAGVRRV